MHIVCCEYVLTWYAALSLSLGAAPLCVWFKVANLAHCMNVMFHLTRLETRTKEFIRMCEYVTYNGHMRNESER